jgi:hypothetical protein
VPERRFREKKTPAGGGRGFREDELGENSISSKKYLPTRALTGQQIMSVGGEQRLELRARRRSSRVLVSK